MRYKQIRARENFGAVEAYSFMADRQLKTSFPKLFTVFSFKSFAESDAVSSPTSILDSKPASVFKTPFWSEPIREPETRHKVDTKGIGLAILDETHNHPPRTVLFGSNLRVQIGGNELRRDSTQSSKSGFGSENSAPFSPNSPMTLSSREMEMSEDYTCVICHGPNPRTIHIFDGFVLESCRTDRDLIRAEDGSCYQHDQGFLSSCYTCRKNLGPGEDTFMYRGEKAFCSTECRSVEMRREEEVGEERDDVFGGCSWESF